MKNILVIVSEETTSSYILKFLTTKGFEATGAEDGDTGVWLAAVLLPDLILCDLPSMSCNEMLRKLRNEPITAAIPVVFLTQKTNQEEAHHLSEQEADSYLIKPFTSNELLQTIANVLCNSQKREFC